MTLKEFWAAIAIYIVVLIFTASSVHGMWKKPDEYKRKSYMPWMDSYLGWTVFRFAASALFILVVLIGIAMLVSLLWEIVIKIFR